ncbi:MAG: cyclodeaminase/cyclohydrolase family protein [Chloroflexaceae bacterium]|nr:cyclodeaminase/cyclohydrolase family protein [Chloroflexaceae bacterium]
MTYPIYEQSVGAFLDALASSEPTPGGGSVAGFSGAMAAGLLSMVCAITLKKKNHDPEGETLQQILTQAETLRQSLQKLTQDDIEVFDRLSAAYKLPRTTDADAASRKSAIQTVTRQAAEVPLQTAHQAAALLPLCRELAHLSGRLLVSDVGVAALLVRATVRAALLNVEINLTSLEDAMFVRQVRAQMADLTAGLDEEVEKIGEAVRNRMNS